MMLAINKTIGRLGGLALLVLSLFVWLAPAREAAAASQQFSESVVFDRSNHAQDNIRIPSILVTTAGTVLAFAEHRFDYPGDDIIGPNDDGPHDLFYKRSTDGGVTWSSNTNLVNSVGGTVYSNPVPVQDRVSGAIYLFYNQKFALTYTYVYYIKSTDDGLTWSAPTDVTSLLDNNPYGTAYHVPGPGHGIQMRNGRLIVQVWSQGPKTEGADPANRNPNITVLYSDNGGTTWQRGGYTDPEVLEMSESRIVETSDGHLLINSRNPTGYSRVLADSADGGLTWTNQRVDASISTTTVDQSLARLTFAANEDKNRLLFTGPNDPTTHDRKNLTVYVSYDEAATWTYSRQITTGFSAYSDIAVLPDHTILVIYEYNTAKDLGDDRYEYIKVARFNLEWATNGSDSVNQKILDTEWDSLAGFNSSGTIVDIDPASKLHLRDGTGTPTKVYREDLTIPAVYTLHFKARVNDYTTGGCSLCTRIVDGQYRLSFKLDTDGLYVINSSGNWVKKKSLALDTEFHTYKIAVAYGNAEVYMDNSLYPLFTYALEPFAATDRMEHWLTGSSSDTAIARIDWTQVY